MSIFHILYIVIFMPRHRLSILAGAIFIFSVRGIRHKGKS